MSTTHTSDKRWFLGPAHIGDYMRRWVFWCPWFGIRLHHILRSDAGRDFHDHPWNFTSVLLSGGYIEHTPVPGQTNPRQGSRARWFDRWSIVRRKATDLHRLELWWPVWTLVFTSRKLRSWGFLTPSGWVPWREYRGAE